jgi:heme/copper-type cytochrome/quinol oxidase subunit 2
MGLGTLQPMHFLLILLTLALLVAVVSGVAFLLVRYAVRYSRQLDRQERDAAAREGR